ncbi:hypothetical protein [Saccharopolyspora hattusasensis]|uniref:hypothetical protein n=1 Tax=Saccharopolyspora hattusasensis TaxID=1128679 RepID=UPI003D953600
MIYQGWPGNQDGQPCPQPLHATQYPLGPQQTPPRKSRVWIAVVASVLVSVFVVGVSVLALLIDIRSGPSLDRDQAAAPPPIPTATTNVCASVDRMASSCSEWARPEPRSFKEVLQLDGLPQQPPESKWSPLYLCSYPPDELMAQFMSADFRKILLNGFICSYETPSPDMQITFDVYVGSGSFDSWTDISPEAEVTDFNGRRLIVDHHVEGEYDAFRSWIMEIPDAPNKVLVLDYKQMPGIAHTGLIPGDQAKADRAIAALGEIYRKASE